MVYIILLSFSLNFRDLTYDVVGVLGLDHLLRLKSLVPLITGVTNVDKGGVVVDGGGVFVNLPVGDLADGAS